MADTEKRIVVEGVEFAQLVQFPRILRAVTAAFQPGRLALGLMMIVVLMTAGRVWDSVFAPSVSPEGLLADRWTDEDHEAAQEILVLALQRAMRLARLDDGSTEVRIVREQASNRVEVEAAGAGLAGVVPNGPKRVDRVQPYPSASGVRVSCAARGVHHPQMPLHTSLHS